MATYSPRPLRKPARSTGVEAALAEAVAAPSTSVSASAIEAAVAQASTADLTPTTQAARSAGKGSSPRPTAKPGRRTAAAVVEDEGEGDRTPAEATEAARPVRKARESIILASASPTAPAPNASPETVDRRTGSGGAWSISLGLFTSHALAEKTLLKTALAESGTLDSARRDVRDTAKGFEARFGKLSRDDAWLTCKRIEARGAECRVIAP